MTVGDGDPNFYDVFSWTPPDQKNITNVPYQLKLSDLFKPDVFICKYLSDYEYFDLLLWYNNLDSFPGPYTLQDLVNYRLGISPAPTQMELADYLSNNKILIPDPGELQQYVLRNTV
jgi:hypothetical protein